MEYFRKQFYHLYLYIIEFKYGNTPVIATHSTPNKQQNCTYFFDLRFILKYYLKSNYIFIYFYTVL